jgi:hypothetical protein
VLAQSGRAQPRLGAHFVEAHRQADQADVAPGRRLHETERACLLVSEHLLHVLDGRARHAGCVERRASALPAGVIDFSFRNEV